MNTGSIRLQEIPSIGQWMRITPDENKNQCQGKLEIRLNRIQISEQAKIFMRRFF
jgi:hypothetical protein